MISKLRGIIPDKVITELCSKDFLEINKSIVKLSHFLSQCAHESRNFQLVEENLNYSKEGLLRVFPKYFTESQALEYSHDPRRIANRVYASRMGNGDELSGEGYKYKGRGYIQLTGRDNYNAFSKYIENVSVLVNPSLVGTKYPLLSAKFFFDHNDIWKYCKDSSEVSIKNVTRRVNGGTNGLTERIKQFNKFYNIFKE